MTAVCAMCRTRQEVRPSDLQLVAHKGTDGKRCPASAGWLATTAEGEAA